jgi:esterase/lipase
MLSGKRGARAMAHSFPHLGRLSARGNIAQEYPMKKILTMLALTIAAAGAYAQAGTAIKEEGKAAVEKTKEGADNVKAAFASEPNKSVDKAKAKVHKAKAKVHHENAKAAASAANN